VEEAVCRTVGGRDLGGQVMGGGRSSIATNTYLAELCTAKLELKR